MADHVKLCTDHPNYDPIVEPTKGCRICRALYDEAVRKLDEHRGRSAHHALEEHIREEKDFRDYLERTKWADEGGNTEE